MKSLLVNDLANSPHLLNLWIALAVMAMVLIYGYFRFLKIRSRHISSGKLKKRHIMNLLLKKKEAQKAESHGVKIHGSW